jgi:hypothetical protein
VLTKTSDRKEAFQHIFLNTAADACAEMFDVEKLIYEVEKRPPLYNITLKDYSNRELKAKC